MKRFLNFIYTNMQELGRDINEQLSEEILNNFHTPITRLGRYDCDLVITNKQTKKSSDHRFLITKQMRERLGKDVDRLSIRFVDNKNMVIVIFNVENGSEIPFYKCTKQESGTSHVFNKDLVVNILKRFNVENAQRVEFKLKFTGTARNMDIYQIVPTDRK